MMSITPISVLCLSRAPTNTKAGIPYFCKVLYKEFPCQLKILSYTISKSHSIPEPGSCVDERELIIKSDLIISSFGFSYRYFRSFYELALNSNILHLQHPDPISSFCLIVVWFLSPKIRRTSKVVVTWHAEVYLSYLPAFPLLFVIDFLLFIIANKIVLPTPNHLKRSLWSLFNFFNAKTIIIPFGLDLPNNVSKQKIVPSATHLRILSIGRLVSYKGYIYALKALRDCNFPFEYVIIGDGPLLHKLRSFCRKYNLEKSVRFAMNVSDELKLYYLDWADVFLFPSISQSEAFGFVQIEAMMSGLLVINTDLKNGVNYVAPFNSSITVKPRDHIEIMEALKLISYNRNLLAKFRRLSLNRAQQFSSSVMRAAYYKLFSELSN